jgi:hypothetical protein
MIHFCCPQTTNISVGKSRWVFEWKMYDSGVCVAPLCHPEPPPTTLHPPVMVSMRRTWGDLSFLFCWELGGGGRWEWRCRADDPCLLPADHQYFRWKEPLGV